MNKKSFLLVGWLLISINAYADEISYDSLVETCNGWITKFGKPDIAFTGQDYNYNLVDKKYTFEAVLPCVTDTNQAFFSIKRNSVNFPNEPYLYMVSFSLNPELPLDPPSIGYKFWVIDDKTSGSVNCVQKAQVGWTNFLQKQNATITDEVKAHIMAISTYNCQKEVEAVKAELLKILNKPAQ